MGGWCKEGGLVGELVEGSVGPRTYSSVPSTTMGRRLVFSTVSECRVLLWDETGVCV